MKKLLALLIVLVLSVTAFASCDAFVNDPDETPDGSGLENAEKYVSALYKEMSVTGADYELVAQVTVDGVTYTVNWAVDVTAGVTVTKNAEKGVWVVDVDELTGADIAYNLKATIQDADGNKAEKTFKLTVPKFKVNTHAEYMAAKEGDNLVIEGIVTGMNSKSEGSKRNHLYLVDESGVGGYYIYDMEKDPKADLKLAVGMKVRVNGEAAPYNGMMEIEDGAVTAVLNNTPAAVSAYNLTAECLKDEPEFTKYVGMLVTIKGVTLGGQDLTNSTDQYLHFTIGNVASYLRTYVTDFPVGVKEADKAIIDAFHKDHFGYISDVTGILIMYGNTAYIVPVTNAPFTNLSLPALEPADEVKTEIAGLDVPALITKSGEFTLPLVGANYTDVKFTWTVDNEDLTYDATTGKVTVTVDEGVNTKVTLSYVATSDNESKSGTVEVALIDPSTLANKIAAAALGATFEDITLTGVVTAIDTAYNEKYGNVTVTIAVADAAGAKVQLYRLALSKDEGAFTTDLSALKVGDTVTAVGPLSAYKGNVQLNVCTLTALKTNEQTATEIKALASGATLAGALTGEVVSVDDAYDSYWKNVTFTIKAGDLTIKVFRAKGEAAELVKVGDTVTVMGIAENGDYGTQFTEGTLIVAYTEGTKYVPKLETELVTDKEYVIGVMWNGKYYFLDGKIGTQDYYITFTDSAKNAAKFKLAATEGGYHVYIDSETKTYLNIRDNDGYKNTLYEAEAKCVWTWDADLNTLVVTIGETKYAITHANTSYANCEAKAISNAGKKAQFFTYAAEDKAADADKLAVEKEYLSIKTYFNTNATLTLPTEGEYNGVTISWAAEGATITDNKVAIVIGNDQQTIKLTATIKSGEATPVTKEFTVSVASKADIEKSALEITTSFAQDGTLTLPQAGTTYTDVAITWVAEGATIVDGVITITQTDAVQTFKLTATIKSSDTTSVTKEFTVTVAKKLAAGAQTFTYNLKTSGITTTVTSTEDVSIDNGNLVLKLVANNFATNQAGEARLYVGKEGVIYSPNAISSVKLTGYGNGGDAKITVKVSNDGTTWTDVTSTYTFSSSSTSQTIDLGGSYNYVKFVSESGTKQLRITDIEIVATVKEN